MPCHSLSQVLVAQADRKEISQQFARKSLLLLGGMANNTSNISWLLMNNRAVYGQLYALVHTWTADSAVLDRPQPALNDIQRVWFTCRRVIALSEPFFQAPVVRLPLTRRG